MTEGLRNLAVRGQPDGNEARDRHRDAGSCGRAQESRHAPCRKPEIEHIATISANDPEIGRLLADAMECVGRDGVITVEQGKGLKLEVEYTEGLRFDRGYISAYFVTDTQRLESALDEPYVLLTNKKLSAIGDLLPLLEKLIETGSKELLIVAEDVDGEALATLVEYGTNCAAS